MTPKPVLVFLHIPKTAGTTLQRSIERQYGRKAVFQLQNPLTEKSIDEYNHLPEDKRRKIRAMHGHVFYGVHERIIDPSTYITILREPVDRVVSHYYFVRRRPRHVLYRQVTAGGIDLEEFINRQMSLEVDNGQVRQLCGEADPFKDIPFGGVTRDMLESARKNLGLRMSAIGLTEDFDRSMILFKRILGWHSPYYYNANVTKERPSLQGIPARIIEMIRESNKLDQELYDSARVLFAQATASQGPAFENEVKVFQQRNEIYGRYLAYSHTQLSRASRAPLKLWQKLAGTSS